MVEITLGWSETFSAAMVGVRRNIQSRQQGRRDRYGADLERAWEMNIVGALGEAAVAKIP